VGGYREGVVGYYLRPRIPVVVVLPTALLDWVELEVRLSREERRPRIRCLSEWSGFGSDGHYLTDN
jgi:hypothetical protein